MEVRYSLKSVNRDKKEMDAVLVSILSRNKVYDWEYCLNGGEEGSVCMMSAGGGWKVFFVERGQVQMCSEFTTKEAAAKELLFRLGRDSSRREQMLKEFREEWKPVKKVIVPEYVPTKAAKVAAQPQANKGMITIPVFTPKPRPVLAMRKVAGTMPKKKTNGIDSAATVSAREIIARTAKGDAVTETMKKVKGLNMGVSTGKAAAKGILGPKTTGRRRSSASRRASKGLK